MKTPIVKPLLPPLRYELTGLQDGVYPFDGEPRLLAEIYDARNDLIAEYVYAEHAAAIVDAVNMTAVQPA